MIKTDKKHLSKFLILAFYLTTMLSITLYEWSEQIAIFSGSGSPIYRNLMDCAAYIRRGFNFMEINKIPAVDGKEWARFKSPPLRVMESPLPDLPKSPFLSPLRYSDEEFTIIIPVEMDNEAINYLKSNMSVLPGIFLAHIGENWEIYFNGRLIHSEMHLNEKGQIKSRRTWRNVGFPLDSSLVKAGTNVLAFRIFGDPTYALTGFFYKTPYYIDEYKIIERRLQDFLALFLAGIFGFIGIYYLLLFLSIRDKKEVYNLFFSTYSILLSIFCIMRHPLIVSIIPDSNIRMRLQYASLMMLMAAFGLFIETLGRGKPTKITKIYSYIFLFFSLTQFIFSPRYSDNVMQIWEYTILIYYTYVFFYDVVYFYFFDKKGPRKNRANKDLDALIFNILIGTFAIFICGIYEILSSIFLSISFSLFVYSAFVVQIGMTFSLSQRFSRMYKQLEKSNTILEIAVHERTIELEKQTEIAIQANRAKSQFLATMSHEIRTPLNAVIGLSEIVLRRGSLQEDSRNDIQQIHQSGSSLLRIINDILDISKIEANSFELIPVEYETASLINDTVTLNMVRVGSKPITFILEINENFPQKLYGDELRVKQIINNILSNAIKYTQKGKVIFSVAWEILHGEAEKKAMVCFTVRDTGIGMHREDIEKLFSVYMQLDAMSNREVEGTGLGLSIVKKIVEMMGGSITVESEYGKGSTFTVSFIQGLVNGGQTAGIGKETAELLKRFQYTSLRQDKEIERSWMPYGKVLVVDDIPVNLKVACGLLEPYGLKVDTAASALETIEKLAAMKSNPTEKKYDLIFMDHMMPGMDGIKAVSFIRNEIGDDYCRNVPIVAFTANALVGSQEMFLSRGFSGFISKPINIVELDNVLNQWVRDKQSPETLRQAEEEKNAKRSALLENIANGTNLASSVYKIAGLDLKQGIAATGGKETGYISVLTIYCKDVENRLPLFQNVPDTNSLPSFVTQVHAIKSASGSIGAVEISEEAAKLEAAGKAVDLSFIEKNLGSFTEHLAELVKNIRSSLEAGTTSADGETSPPGDTSSVTAALLRPLLRQLADELKAQNAGGIDRILADIDNLSSHQQPDLKTKEALEQISDQILMAEYDTALKIINDMIL